MSEQRIRDALAWLVIALLTVPVGGALWLGVAHGEAPCILCWAQRTSMVLIALVGIFVVRYGPRARYLGMAVLLAAWGTFMALRHSALHLARDVGQGFAGSILGAHTYVWSWVIHWIVLIAIGAMLLPIRGGIQASGAQRTSRAGTVAMLLLVIMAAGNAVQAFVTTGPPPYIGQADPIRMSFNPKYWVWMNEELAGPISWRGSWTIPSPEATSVDPDPAAGPIAGVPTLPVVRWERITAPYEGTVTDFAVSDNGRAVITAGDFGVYVLDASFGSVLHHVVLDHGFSIDLTPLAGAAFVGDTIAVMSTNKSYVLLREDAAADPLREWRHFRASSGGMTELRRSRFATERARQMYVLSLAYDAAAQELITITVPSPRHQRMVVSRFAREDLLLSSEFRPRTRQDVDLGAYMVTGATVVDGRLYAISAAHSTLLVIDLATKELTAAFAVPGLSHPVGLAARASELLIAQADGRIAVLARP